jgi:hypothetical protein
VGKQLFNLDLNVSKFALVFSNASSRILALKQLSSSGKVA